MTQLQDHLAASRSIDDLISRDGFESVTRTSDYKYPHWYASALSAMAILSHSEDVEYARGSFPAADQRIVRLIVFTTNRLLLVDTETDFDGSPLVRAFSRKALTSIELSAGERIDAQDRRAHDWPGTIYMLLKFEEIDGPIEIVVSGSLLRLGTDSPVLDFVHSLAQDI